MAKRKPSRQLDLTLPIYQLKITLQFSDPPIWRRVQIDDCQLRALHDIIQECMDWEDDHLHGFAAAGEVPESTWISQLVERGFDAFNYCYDYGDSWDHLIEVEATLPANPQVHYPRCTGGERACPPEDCGGVYGYEHLLDVMRHPDDPEHEDRLEWLGDDFDPELFDLDEVNRRLRYMRGWIGKARGKHSPEPKFAKGNRVRVKSGVASPEWPDIPMGRWLGTVEAIAYVSPVSCLVAWSEETLEHVHPVYCRRCSRDELDARRAWLDEDQLEPDPGEPLDMEQPTQIVVRPLSMDDADDRIRAVFALTGDDPLPACDKQSQQTYYDYLKGHLSFPFEARWRQEGNEINNPHTVSVIGMLDSFPVEESYGVMCAAREGDQSWELPLTQLEIESEHPNSQLGDDYVYWFYDAAPDPDDEEDLDDEDEDEDEDDYEDDYEDDDEFGIGEEDFRPGLLGGLADEFEDDAEEAGPAEGPAPIVRGERVGRNDPCPCGSGKKYKKCCLKK